MRTVSGYSYVEVLIASALLAATLLPLMEAAGNAGGWLTASDDGARRATGRSGRMEDVLSRSFGEILAAAGVAGGTLNPSTYSDPAGTPERLLVYVARYDALNADGDADPFTVPDANADGDANPFTGEVGLLWVAVGYDDESAPLQALTAP